MSQCGKPYTSKDKWIVASIAGLMFFLFSSPVSFMFTNTITRGMTWNTHPTVFGLILHAFLFLLTTRLMIR